MIFKDVVSCSVVPCSLPTSASSLSVLVELNMAAAALADATIRPVVIQLICIVPETIVLLSGALHKCTNSS